MMKKTVFGFAVAFSFGALAALVGACGSESGANGDVASEQAAISGPATLTAGSACNTHSGASCEKGLFCDVSGVQGVCGAEGVCTVTPTACPYDAPLGGVCGCDGNDYINGCFAAREGVGVNHPGPCGCEPKANGAATETCASGFYCSTTVSSSGVCAKSGTCVADGPCSELCSVQPWCGCDGKTYTGCNKCLDTVGAGVTMAYEGACK